MSQRLLVTLEKNVTSKDSYFDAIYTEEGTLKELLCDWCLYESITCTYVGPWKITIRGHEVIDQFMEDFIKLKKYVPDLQSLKDCCSVYDNEDLVWSNPEMDFEMGEVFELLEKHLLEEEEEEESEW